MNRNRPATWQKLLDADLPTPAQMAAEEAELRRLPPASPMPRERIDELVARAVASPPRRDAPERRTRRPHAVLLAVVAVLSIGLLGWFARELWPEQQFAPLELDYMRAVYLATEPARDDRAYMSALTIVAENCAFGADALRRVAAADGVPTLAAEAKRIRAELGQLLANGTTAMPEPAGADLVERASTALDPNQPVDVRMESLVRLGALLRSGLTAMLVAPLASDASRSGRDVWLTELAADLRR